MTNPVNKSPKIKSTVSMKSLYSSLAVNKPLKYTVKTDRVDYFPSTTENKATPKVQPLLGKYITT